MNKYLLYRILGNDLPPRHERGQTLRNLKFILDHEGSLAGCRKKWIVNRIFDREEEKKILGLLSDQKQPFLHIPFRSREYRKLDPGDRAGRIRYFANNNGARNLALEDGKGQAEWILPFDGNCFFNSEGWKALAGTILENEGRVSYVLVPLIRLCSTERIPAFEKKPDPSKNPEAWINAEPQIAFRHDAREKFREDLFYGYIPKAELLTRLGVPGPWHSWGSKEKRSAKKNDEESWCVGGHVCRLPSGNPEAEEDADLRARCRNLGIKLFLQKLDIRAGRFHLGSRGLGALRAMMLWIRYLCRFPVKTGKRT